MYKPARQRASDWRIGAAVDGFMLDLEAAAAAYARKHPTDGPGVAVPASILELLRREDDAWVGVQRVHDWARGYGSAASERQLDYETELAVVIGSRCKNVPQARAYEVIAGYTVLSDIVARQVLKIERAAGNQFLGKMFDAFGPLGPWLVTKDEVADPMNLTITTRVNGEVRQHGNTGRMIWNIPQLIAYFSQATLEPGDSWDWAT